MVIERRTLEIPTKQQACQWIGLQAQDLVEPFEEERLKTIAATWTNQHERLCRRGESEQKIPNRPAKRLPETSAVPQSAEVVAQPTCGIPKARSGHILSAANP
ncbi:MAG: hypothetical protein QM784_12520 [Polyangiaceae bacterium]